MSISFNKKTDKLFIAVSMHSGHSFLMLGVYEQYKVKHLLCRVGKWVGESSSQGLFSELLELCSTLFNALVSSAPSSLNSEAIARSSLGAVPINYQAYEITFDQYLDFIQLLEHLQTETSPLYCFKPIEEKEEEIVLERTKKPIFTEPLKGNSIKTKINQFSVDNTCRHATIQLTEEVRKAPVSPLVSSNFFTKLPYKTRLDYGKPSEHIPFYVLPAPPSAYSDLGKTNKRIAFKLYEKMEELLLLDTDSVKTQNKFSHLNELYHQMIGPQKHASLNELLHAIQSWRQKNQTDLNALRKTYFWDEFLTRDSATMKLIYDIEDKLQAQIKF